MHMPRPLSPSLTGRLGELGWPTHRHLCAVALPGVLMIGVLSFFGDDYRKLIEDAASYTQQSSYLGLFSNLGILGWWTAAVAAGMAAFLLPPQRAERAPLLYAALLTAWLALDDLFLLHEGIVRNRLGVPEEVWFAAYAAMLGIYVWRYRFFHLRRDPLMLLLALGLMAASIVVDVFFAKTVAYRRLASVTEEAAKFAAIACWMLYHLDAARDALRHRDRSPG